MGPQKTQSRRMSNANPGLLLLASAALLFASNVQLASAVCEDLEAACEDDDVCSDCLTYMQSTEDVSVTECSARYPDVWDHQAIEGYTASFCESSGAMYCCALEDNDAAETCLDNTAAASYWNCLMDDIGCTAEDIPCYTGADYSPAASTPTPASVDHTGEPSSSSSSSTSSSTTPSSTTWSSSTSTPVDPPSSSSTSSLPECDAEIAECENDEKCVECTASTSSTHHGFTSECSDRYPDSFNYVSEGGTRSFCETEGAYFCCEFETEVFAETCLQNAATANYWNCLTEDVGCSVDDMPCYTGVAVNPEDSSSTSSSASETPAPVPAPARSDADSADGAVTPAPVEDSASTSASSTSGEGSNDRGLDITPSPTSVGSGGSSGTGSGGSASPAGVGGASPSPTTVGSGGSSATGSGGSASPAGVGGASPSPTTVGSGGSSATGSGGSASPAGVGGASPSPTTVGSGGSSATSSGGSASPAGVVGGATPSPTAVTRGGSSASGSDVTVAPTSAPTAADADTNTSGAARVAGGASSSVLALGCAVWLLAAVV